MKQLYPAIIRIALITAFIIYNVEAMAQTLNFNTPSIVSGTDLQPGCVYRFSSITNGGLIDALVKIDSLIGVSLSGIDATPSGSSSTALQPQLSSLGGVGYHYAVITINFVARGTSIPSPVYNFSSVFMGIDGSNQMMEFHAITLANPTWQYVSPTPKVAVTQNGDLVWGTATSSKPTGGQGIDETDSTQMYRVSSASPSSATMRIGWYQNQAGWNGNDLFSLNMRGGDLAPTLLPVTLVSFTAQLANDKVWLTWSTKQEDNVSNYGIEKSYDGKEFEQTGLLFPAEEQAITNNYSFKDPVKNTAVGVIYYRLKMVDKNGQYKYSEIRTVRIGNSNNGSARITTWPNPVANELHVSLPTSWADQTVSCQVLNGMGSLVKSFTIQQTAIIGLSDVPPGTYYIKLINGKEAITQTIIKSKN
ncbi:MULTISPECIES: T9SS type A sorting domain-containing protein [Niastella]|uniref:T9SS type A sorting domain-containing protein n=1 Tax=Niastella soli TaxID=2821487 RepID=A0ABS3YNP5_9BACT|nr:T9SS type A sorting domain-containing protein [Niastella soli]MBO9198881.1 T9SS type A sorting domain-containing protein [Niastella soli]